MSSARVLKVVRLIVPAAKAKPSPSIGQALGALGINMMAFCKEFNVRTAKFKDEIPMRVFLKAKSDQTFAFDARMPQTTWFIKQAADLDTCAYHPGKEVAGSIHVKQIYEIAKLKQQDSLILQATPLEGICKSIVQTARSMGIVVDRARENEKRMKIPRLPPRQK
jgi:large subunit ribosomal protein L11